MASYESFAEVYDMYMDNVPYRAWSENLLQILEKYQIPKGLLADLGCGTGTMTRLLQQQGYDMIGIDNSCEMLDIARQKGPKDILYLCQDMRSFELYGTVGAMVSVCDSMNYLTEKEDLISVIRLANNYLDPGGIFIFDMNTMYKYREILADGTFAENREQGSFIWENEFDPCTGINAYELTLYIAEAEGASYRRYVEEHFQKAYETEEIKDAVSCGGMELLEILDVETMGEITETTERIYVICREHGKEV